jgi:hypothetical protein
MRFQAAVTDREDRLTMEDGVPRRDFWGVSGAVTFPPTSQLWAHLHVHRAKCLQNIPPIEQFFTFSPRDIWWQCMWALKVFNTNFASFCAISLKTIFW